MALLAYIQDHILEYQYIIHTKQYKASIQLTGPANILLYMAIINAVGLCGTN
jgi:hypothetical protein